MRACSNSVAAPEHRPAVQDAVAALRRGGTVVYPTETFYGLGVDATNATALEHLLRLKVRPAGKPVAVLVSDRGMLAMLVREVPPPAERLMDRFWPGPLTLVLPARASVPHALTGGSGTLGVRWSGHPVATALITALGRPVTAPSANPAAAAPPVTVAQARAYFGDAVDAYVDGGALPGGLASTVVEVTGSAPAAHPDGARSDAVRSLGLRIIREGVIPAERILALAGTA
jgi:L-threonylcarbamoyladenylate synthase